MLDLVNIRNIFTSFPEEVAPLTKSQLKKLQKIKEAQDKKANKKKSKSKSKSKEKKQGQKPTEEKKADGEKQN